MWWWMAVASADPGVREPIVNGAVEDGYPSAVGLAFGPFVFCSGSLVTPRIVLTAGHCVAEIGADTIEAYATVISGTRATAPVYEMAIQRAVLDPDYEPLTNDPVLGSTLPRNDVAVIVLRDDAPPDLVPVWFRTEHLGKKEATGEIVTSVGYGEDENGIAGVKRSADLVIHTLADQFVVSDNADNENDANICSGDSGGPQYHVEADGSLLEWAVHSWGDQNCAVDSGSTLTDRTADFLLAQVKKVHGSTDHCEFEGLYGDGACDSHCERVDPDCTLTLQALLRSGSGDPGGCSTAPGAGGLYASLGLLGLVWRERRRAAAPAKARTTPPSDPLADPGA